MIVVTRRPLTRVPTLGAALAAGTLLARLDQALAEGTCPRDCYCATGTLLHLGVVEMARKDVADAFVCWLRELCGRHFDQLVRVTFTQGK